MRLEYNSHKGKVHCKPTIKSNVSKQLKFSTTITIKPMLFAQHRGNIFKNFAGRLKKLSDNRTKFTTRVLKTCLPTLQSSFDENLRSHVVYKVKWNRCRSIYFGQTSRHVTTRIREHQKKESSVRQHLVECCGATYNTDSDFLDVCHGFWKLDNWSNLRKNLKAQLNTRDKYPAGNWHWSVR